LVFANRAHPAREQVRGNIASCEANSAAYFEKRYLTLLLEPSNARDGNFEEVRYFRDRQQL
jgi:hypothetical protein